MMSWRVGTQAKSVHSGSHSQFTIRSSQLPFYAFSPFRSGSIFSLAFIMSSQVTISPFL